MTGGWISTVKQDILEVRTTERPCRSRREREPQMSHSQDALFGEAVLQATVEPETSRPSRIYTLLGPDGRSYRSRTPGLYGGNKWNHLYGTFTCQSALETIAKGGYVRNRVFFATEADAILAGYRPCGTCMNKQYRKWLKGILWFDPSTLFPSDVPSTSR